jgi:hypothetical protein
VYFISEAAGNISILFYSWCVQEVILDEFTLVHTENG